MKKTMLALTAAFLLNACSDYKSMTLKELAALPQKELQEFMLSLSAEEQMAIAFKLTKCTDIMGIGIKIDEEKCSRKVKDVIEQK